MVFDVFLFLVNSKLQISSLFVGEVLRGDRIVNTLYNVQMNKDKKCEMVCSKKKLSKDQSKLVAERISEEYYVHL